MATYTTPLILNGQPVPGELLPSAAAFNTVFGIGLVLTVIVLALAATSKNYTFKGAKKEDTGRGARVTSSTIRRPSHLSSARLQLTES